MKYQNIVVYLIIPLALLSIPSLLENVQAQTNSTNQIPLQQNQNANLTAQALMKVNTFELKDALMKVNLAIVDGNLKEALTGVRDIESQLLQVKPMPTKFLDNIHKAVSAIAKEDIDKALNTLTGIQVTIVKAENKIFKAAVENPQVIQEVKAALTNPQMIQQFNTIEPNTDEEEYSKDIEKYSKDTKEDSKDTRQQFNTMETIIDEEEYYKEIEDT
jgi:hypothetical protein